MDLQAIFDNFRRTVTEHYFDMHGRVGRSQFWYFVLVNFVFAIVAAILQSVTFLPLAALYNLAMLLPAAGMGARRLQDTGRDGLVPAEFPVTANGISGYSGGGKAMIAEFEDPKAADYTQTVSRIYGLNLTHKHIPEMQKHAGLTHPPLFEPSIGRFYRGMLVEV